MTLKSIACGILSLILIGLSVEARDAATADEYTTGIETFRTNRQTRMTADDGWLTVAGMFWFKDGVNSVGSNPSNDFVLPAGAPAKLGRFVYVNGQTLALLEPAAGALINGKPATQAAMFPGVPDRPADRITVGTLTMFVHKSGGRYGIRMRDTSSKLRRDFTGLKWHPVNPAYRVVARFTPYDAPKVVAMNTVAGHDETPVSIGYASFTLNGKELKLEPTLTEDGKELFFVFGDATNGDTTYKGGRFVNAGLPTNGQVVIDFNRTYNPPCVFNPYTTCQIPRPENRLPVRIDAGERAYPGPGAKPSSQP